MIIVIDYSFIYRVATHSVARLHHFHDLLLLIFDETCVQSLYYYGKLIIKSTNDDENNDNDDNDENDEDNDNDDDGYENDKP